VKCKNCGKEIVNSLVFGWVHKSEDGHIYNKYIYCEKGKKQIAEPVEDAEN